MEFSNDGTRQGVKFSILMGGFTTFFFFFFYQNVLFCPCIDKEPVKINLTIKYQEDNTGNNQTTKHHSLPSPPNIFGY